MNRPNDEDEGFEKIEHVSQHISDQEKKKVAALPSMGDSESKNMNLEEFNKATTSLAEAAKVLEEAAKKLNWQQTFWYYAKSIPLLNNIDTGNAEYDQLEKEFKSVDNQKESVGIASPWDKYVPDLVRSVIPMVVLSPLQTLACGYYGVQYYRKSQELSSGNLRGEERKNLEKEVIRLFLNALENGSIMKYLIPGKDSDQASILLDRVVGDVIPSITDCPGIFKGVEEKFVKNLTVSGLNVLCSILTNAQLNKIAQEIYKDLQSPINNSIRQIIDIDHVLVIMADPEVNTVIQNELIPLLDNTNHHPELVKIVKNYLKDNLNIQTQLFNNTVSLMVENGSTILSLAPSLLKIYGIYLDYSDVKKDASEKDSKDTLISLLSTVGNLQPSLAPVLKSEFLGYLQNNKKDIGELFKAAISENMSYDAAIRELIDDSVDVTMSFVIDGLPLIVGLAEESLKNPEMLAAIVEQTQVLMNSSQKEFPQATSNLLNLCKKFGEANPSLQENFSKRLLPLLDKKFTLLIGAFLGHKVPIEETVNVLVQNNELREQILKVFHIYPDLTFSQHLLPIIGLILMDGKALKLALGAFVGYCRDIVDEYLVPNGIRNKFIGSPINKALEDISKSHKEGAGRYDLAAELRKKCDENNKTADHTYSSTLVYSITTRDLQGLSLQGNFDNCIMKGFNFNHCKFTNFSCNNAKLINCSFQNISFLQGASFKGAEIDVATLYTLLPLLEKHNKAKPHHLLDLHKIKIIGTLPKEMVSHHLLPTVAQEKASPPLQPSYVARVIERQTIKGVKGVINRAAGRSHG